MKLLAFSVYDEKAESFATPFFLSSIGQATRIFGDMANDDKSQIGKHPEDYKLYQVGTWDYDKAIFTTIEPPRLISNAKDYIEITPNIREVK